MTNKDIINEFVTGNRECNAINHIGYNDSILFNYSTIICKVDRANKTAQVNIRKYSATTSKIQSMLLAALQGAGYGVEKYEGGDAYIWNYGYPGAPKLKKSDFR